MRPINAHTVNAQYRPNGKAYTNFKLGTQTEHEDPYHRQALWPPRSKVKVARSHEASNRCWPISREWNVLETPKLVWRLPTPRATMRTSFHVRCQRSKSPSRLILKPKVRHIFLTERPMNLKLDTQMEYVTTYRRQAPWPPEVKFAMSRDASDRCWPKRTKNW